jgi:hypothetical protein
MILQASVSEYRPTPQYIMPTTYLVAFVDQLMSASYELKAIDVIELDETLAVALAFPASRPSYLR